MDPDHPPVDVLRLAGRAATLCGLFAGAVRIATFASPMALTPAVAVWALVIGVLFSAAIILLTVPSWEPVAASGLVAAAVVGTIHGGGVALGLSLGWTHGYALLFLAAGLFHLSAWAWTVRETPSAARARAAEEEPEHVQG